MKEQIMLLIIGLILLLVQTICLLILIAGNGNIFSDMLAIFMFIPIIGLSYIAKKLR